jgi:ribosomal protein L11 methyltransferase
VSASWKLSAHASKERVQAALLAHDDAWDWDPEVVLSGREVAEDRPDEWVLEAWLPRRPGKADKSALAALFGENAPAIVVENVPEADWLVVSQQNVEPVRAGRFHVHTPDFAPLTEPGAIDFAIPASQAFGTGHHATTAGCLATLDAMKRRGLAVRNLADIGTGTGLLAFAALALWPRALATASDIDPVCLGVVADNAAANGVRMGPGAGALTTLAAEGMEHPLLQARAPYDLLIANILAGPLVELAEDFARAVIPGGSVLLAGLLTEQEATLRAAYRRAGFRLAARRDIQGWSILWLRRRG